jgi:hypothetical protein
VPSRGGRLGTRIGEGGSYLRPGGSLHFNSITKVSTNMSRLKIAGLCLASMLVMGMALAGSASAAELFYGSCQKSAAGTKYSGETCEKAESTGEWGVGELASTEKAVTIATLRLADTKVPLAGEVAVSCTGEALGLIGLKKIGRTEEIKNIKCSNVKGCESTPTVEPLGLPWKTELTEIENEAKEKSPGATLKSEKEEAGWAVTCTVLGIKETDKCVTNSAWITDYGNRFTDSFFNPAEARWLVLLEFLNIKGHKAKCSIGGSEAGTVKEHLAVLYWYINNSDQVRDGNLLLIP